MYDEDIGKPEKRRRGRAVDAIVRAVLTGIFILSMLLNVVFILVIVIMGSAMNVTKYDQQQTKGYKKVYLDDEPLSAKAAGDEIAVSMQ
jgi:hypothetical protein